ncbi:hypothetical protein TUBRATIS_14220 [Tubulinosema ratisbonensis]|uniref:Uncharacterized protein n=1 Tax=Tubulinosema ratisbonensis TaxID=291195 RepID=A0A437ALW6_9MICR|nr:hypothetical protein TUBRATIS_14220 [Tubulinosema ratisbonensis]
MLKPIQNIKILIFFICLIQIITSEIDSLDQYDYVYTIQKFKSTPKSLESFKNFVENYEVIQLKDKENVYKSFIYIQGILENIERFKNPNPLTYNRTKIILEDAWSSTLKDYLFDIKEVFTYFDPKSKHRNYVWSYMSSKNEIFAMIREYFLDFSFNYLCMDEIFHPKDLDLETILEILSTNFKSWFTQENLNSKKIYESRDTRFLRYITENEDNIISFPRLEIILKFYWKCLVEDPGYEIIKILFPEILVLINLSIARNRFNLAKRIHILLGMIALRIQNNLQEIQKEIFILKESSDPTITKSNFLNHFIFKTRFYASIMIFSMNIEGNIYKYYIFLAFLSYIRLFYPRIFQILPYDEVFCANISLEESIRVYNNYFYDIYLIFDESIKKIKIEKLKLNISFININDDRQSHFKIDLSDGDLFFDKDGVINFKSINDFKKMLHENTFFALLRYFHNRNE